MPTKPKTDIKLEEDSSKILNAVRNDASSEYKNYVPVATDKDSFKTIWGAMRDRPSLQNELVASLVNRIGMVLFDSKMYQNHFSIFKKGKLTEGEVIEEIFFELVNARQYTPDVTPEDIFKIDRPDIQTAFHVINSQIYYPVAVQRETLQKAMLGGDINSLITGIVGQLVRSASYDEEQLMKYELAKNLIGGDGKDPSIHAESVDVNDTPADIAEKIKSTVNLFDFMSRKFNKAGVRTSCSPADTITIMTSAFNAKMNVKVEATAFNMDKVQFLGQVLTIDSFGALDNERLAMLVKDYEPISSDVIAILDSIPCMVMDKEFMQIYDTLETMTNVYDGTGLNQLYRLHVWKVISTSPFANVVAFYPSELVGTVDSISFTKAPINTRPDVPVKFEAEALSTDGIINSAVTFSLESGDGRITSDGWFYPKGDTGSAVVRATSVHDSSVSETRSIDWPGE